MVVLAVVKYGDELLTQQATVVTAFDESLRQLATDLLDTMNAANGAGMAANQVGVRDNPRAGAHSPHLSPHGRAPAPESPTPVPSGPTGRGPHSAFLPLPSGPHSACWLGAG